jgi:hypothetical protein
VEINELLLEEAANEEEENDEGNDENIDEEELQGQLCVDARENCDSAMDANPCLCLCFGFDLQMT